MSATLCEEPLQLRSVLTLEELLARAHEGVAAHGVADCPVCGGALTPAGADAQCNDCGSRLA
jgi:tRNA(Ile2) C34 agmatinyltransferase TiaS